MPFNGSGGFTRVRNWVADAAANVKIRADYHDSEDDNFASGLSNAICKDGQTVVTADIPWNAKKLTNVANPVNPQDAATKGFLDSGFEAKRPVGQSLSFIQRTAFLLTASIPLHADTRSFLVQVQGAGGGGGGLTSPSAGNGACGGGGGSGGYVEMWIIRTAGMTPTCTIGNAATGGALANPGGSGGTTSYSDGTNTLTASGGAGGAVGINGAIVGTAGGAGGATSGGQINANGWNGEWGDVTSIGATFKCKSGRGADSRFGSGGGSTGVTTGTAVGGNGNHADGRGAGGSGAFATPSGGGRNGGNGSAGAVWVTEFR